YQLGLRTYDPAKGAFLQPDHFLGSAGAVVAAAMPEVAMVSRPHLLNRMTYAKGDPANLTDPDGHDICRENPSECVNSDGTPNIQMMDDQAQQSAPGSSGRTNRRPQHDANQKRIAKQNHDAVKNREKALRSGPMRDSENQSDGNDYVAVGKGDFATI